jgi:ABC-type bacteriocin/lantibiotic exporter with double-glycine peptidase domain
MMATPSRWAKASTCAATLPTASSRRSATPSARSRCANCSHRFDARDTAQDGISFIARRGEMICVMGPSGCGKSTLLRVLGGQLKPKGGEVLMNGLAAL